MATENRANSMNKMKSTTNLNVSSPKVKPSSSSIPIPINKKKIENSLSTKKIVDLKQKSVTTITKSEVKGKSTTLSSSKTVTKTTGVRVKSVKRVYTLPGQKSDPPEEREPLRIFYESLSKQIPSSEMAEFWMMEHGLLSPEKAKKAFARKQKRQQQIRMGIPIKPRKPETSQKPQPSKNVDIKPKKPERVESSQKPQPSKNVEIKPRNPERSESSQKQPSKTVDVKPRNPERSESSQKQAPKSADVKPRNPERLESSQKQASKSADVKPRNPERLESSQKQASKTIDGKPRNLERPESSLKQNVSKSVDIRSNKRVLDDDDDNDFIVKLKKVKA